MQFFFPFKKTKVLIQLQPLKVCCYFLPYTLNKTIWNQYLFNFYIDSKKNKSYEDYYKIIGFLMPNYIKLIIKQKFE